MNILITTPSLNPSDNVGGISNLTNLLINPKKEEKTIESVLTGFSLNRDILLKFKEDLEKKEEIKDVYFPTSSWIKATDINFTINFKIKWQ